MSYMLLSHETFRAIASTLISFRHSTEDSLQRPISVVPGYTTEKYIIDMVKGLYKVNYRTCEMFHGDGFRSDDYVNSLIEKELNKYVINKTETLDIYQMLKSCECLQYNCYSEVPHVDSYKYLIFLRDIVDGIRCHLIGRMPEYQDAKWK